MITYLILRNPGHNRVYYHQSEKLALAELKIAALAMDQDCSDIQPQVIAGISYLSFSVDTELSAVNLAILARLSFIFALFVQQDEGAAVTLVPLEIPSYEYIDPKISSLLKYSGKTNEIFTRMMINVALLSSGYDLSQKIQLLDPVAGKGTSLYEAAISGFNATGVEIDRNLAHETTVFFKKYLEREKYKHSLVKNRVYNGSGTKESYVQHFEYAATKEEFKTESTRKTLDIIAGTALHSKRYFKDEKFHLIVGDLPYGIAHGNVANKKHGSKTRSPSELLLTCLPDWYKILKEQGALVLAWNTFVLPRLELVKLLEQNGFKVLKSSPYDEFTHRVDQSIKRDIVVALKVS